MIGRHIELANLQLNKSVIGVGAREIPLPSECVCGRPQNVFSVNSPSTPFHMIIPFYRRRIYLPTYCVRLLVRSWRDRHGSLNPYNININRPDRYSSGFGKYTDFRVFSLPFPLSLDYFFGVLRGKLTLIHTYRFDQFDLVSNSPSSADKLWKGTVMFFSALFSLSLLFSR